MKKVLIVATVYGFVCAFERNDIRLLQEAGYEVWCACNTEESDGRLEALEVKVEAIPFARSPFSKINLSAYQCLVDLMKREKFDLLHCHTPVGGVLSRIAAEKVRVPRIIYTAHGFHFYKGAPKQNWLLYYPIEKWLAKKTDILITINQEDYQLAKKNFNAKQVEYVPGVGVDVERIQNIVGNVDKERKKDELGIPRDAFLILSVGELNENKNHQIVIRAIAKLVGDVNIRYLICGQGEKKQMLRELADSLGIGNKIEFLGFRKDVIEIMASADLYVHPSYREGLSVAVMEAMAAGLPIICSHIRGNRDLVQNYVNGLLVNKEDNYKDSIEQMMADRKSRLEFAKKSSLIARNFDVSCVENCMKRIYGK